MKKTSSTKTMLKSLPKEVFEINKTSLEAYSHYKKAQDIIEQVNIAMGKKINLQSSTNSTLNVEVNTHGISSTQKI